MTLDPKALDALRWYADPERWEACGSIQSPGAHPLLESAAAADLGRRAREVLAALDREPLVPPAPATFLFGFDEPFGRGELCVWIVAERFYREHGYLNDSSSGASVVTEAEQEQMDESEYDKLCDEASTWLDAVTRGVLFGESMESCWDAEIREGETREQAIERIKADLVARGLVHDPDLDMLAEDGDL